MGERSEEGAPLELRQDPECLCPTFDATGQLTFQWRSPGWRYYLDEQGVHAGDILEMLLSDGEWQPVRFEWNYQAGSKPILFTNEESGFAMPDEARFRWPTDIKGN